MLVAYPYPKLWLDKNEIILIVLHILVELCDQTELSEKKCSKTFLPLPFMFLIHVSLSSLCICSGRMDIHVFHKQLYFMLVAMSTFT